MRKRNNRVLFHLNDEEYVKLNNAVELCGLKREPYIRSLLMGYLPQPRQPLDYFKMMNELRAIGNNINQLTIKAHQTGSIDAVRLNHELEKLNTSIIWIKKEIAYPKKID